MATDEALYMGDIKLHSGISARFLFQDKLRDYQSSGFYPYTD